MNPTARKMLQEPADCTDAQGNIEVLQDSRAGGGKRFMQGFQGIFPAAVVLSLLRDIIGKPYRSIYLDHWRVAFGSYNKKIDKRVAELETCGG
jgi:hypothetical protein